MSIPFQFNAQTVRPADADYVGGGWPSGEFPAVVIGHEVKPTAAGNGGYVELTLQGIDQSPVAGTTSKWRLNLFNSSAKAVEIAQQQLSALCHSVGYFQFNTTDDFVNLYNKPFTAKYGPQKEKPEYTECKGVKPYAPFNPATMQQSATQQPQQATQQAPMQQQPQQPVQQVGWTNTAQQPTQQAAWGQQQQPQQATQQAPMQQQPQQQPQQPVWNGAAQQQQPVQQQQQPVQQQPQQQAAAWTPGATPQNGVPTWAGGGK